MIRHATAFDIGSCVEMAREFWQHTIYSEHGFDAPHVKDMMELCLGMELLLVLDIEGEVEGFAAAIAQPLLGHGQILQCTELAYWVNPKHRGRHGLPLLEGLECAAADRGAVYMNMMSMESSDPYVAQRIYERRGYEKIETTYCKKLRRSL